MTGAHGAFPPSRAPARTLEVGRQLVDAAALAEILAVERSWVYEHADALGAYRLGSGLKARLRFDPAETLERLRTCPAGREPTTAASPMVEPKRRRRRQAAMGTNVPLLPIRGEK